MFYFPKASLAVNIAEMGFWNEDSSWDQLKLRVAYGEAGNFPPARALFTSYDAFTTNGLIGLTVRGSRGNPDLKSERSKELEFGMDLGFFDGRLSFSGTYYIKTIEDLILEANIPASSGFSTEWGNFGELENKGYELFVEGTPVVNENFEWYSSMSFYTNESEITQLDVPAYNDGAFGATLGTFRIEQGQSATQIIGIYPADMQAQLDPEIKDLPFGVMRNLISR